MPDKGRALYDDGQMINDTVQQPYNVQQYTDDMEHIEDMQQNAENMLSPPDTMQQQPDDMDYIEDIELAQNSIPSMQWSDSVDSEEKTRRQFVSKVVMEVIKKSKLTEARDPVMTQWQHLHISALQQQACLLKTITTQAHFDDVVDNVTADHLSIIV
ncbi:unnamed protein product [Pleuronectes platessa]|uniref:Uncharacterized protein n=1 Tax=Pleuronectes platessa TaxID=8262 RepID=A0A9N7TIJ3_PLEPL|nr:unnamed protein product [Pleuronectes platessa]